MTSTVRHNPTWSLGLPVIAAVLLVLAKLIPALPGAPMLLGVVVIAAVIAAVHHAEVIAHRVGEPFGTLVLALAVTIIESALIISMMMSSGDAAASLPRDTVYAAVMLIMNGLIGVSLLVGARRHHVQQFRLEGMNAAMATLATILVLTLILPGYTATTPGPAYSRLQLGFVAVAVLVLFAAFTLFQTVRHRDYFLPPAPLANVPIDEDADALHAAPPTARDVLLSAGLLAVSLITVVLGAKAVSPVIEAMLVRAGAPQATVGILIAAIVLLPESVAALRAALANRVQTSLNLGIGSAIATIGLTIPAVVGVALVMGWPLALGLDAKSQVLLAATLFVAGLTLRTGRTNALLGVVHLVLFSTYLFLSFVP